jgi:hypothetical protein
MTFVNALSKSSQRTWKLHFDFPKEFPWEDGGRDCMPFDPNSAVHILPPPDLVLERILDDEWLRAVEFKARQWLVKAGMTAPLEELEPETTRRVSAIQKLWIEAAKDRRRDTRVCGRDTRAERQKYSKEELDRFQCLTQVSRAPVAQEQAVAAPEYRVGNGGTRPRSL